MRVNPNFWSDEFDVVDDSEFTVVLDDDLDDPSIDNPSLESHVRKLSPWQELEERLGERQLRSNLGEWDYWDDFLSVHRARSTKRALGTSWLCFRSPRAHIVAIESY